jgi:serine/threonine-protein kinase
MTLAESGNIDVWVYEWERDVMTRLTTAPGYDHIPVWTPDGKHIVFSSVRNSPLANLYWIRSDGGGEAIRLTESKNYQAAASFSPDGKRLLFKECDLRTGCGLWLLPLEQADSDHPKAGKPEPFLVTPFDEGEPEISPDGRWVAYDSNESGTNEVYVRHFPGPGGKWRISTGTGGAPVWSRKRQELFYRGADDAFMVVNYTVTGETFEPGKPQMWSEGKTLGDCDLAADGKRFAAVQLQLQEQKGPTHVTIVLNFFDELRRRAPTVVK